MKPKAKGGHTLCHGRRRAQSKLGARFLVPPRAQVLINEYFDGIVAA